MKHLPYFATYPDNWLGSGAVARMTLEEQGAFFRLLCHGWAMDGIPSDQQELALLLGLEPGSPKASAILRRVIDLAWKADPDNPRILRNDRQEAERTKATRLYHLKVEQMAHARSANPIHQNKKRHSKCLSKPLHKALPENKNQTLLREGPAQMSDPEQQPTHSDILQPDWEAMRARIKPPTAGNP